MKRTQYQAPCPCGSGKQFKDCCFAKNAANLEATLDQFFELLPRYQDYLLTEGEELLDRLIGTLSLNAPWLQVQAATLEENFLYSEGTLLENLIDNSSVDLPGMVRAYSLFYRDEEGNTPLLDFREKLAARDAQLLDSLLNAQLRLMEVIDNEDDLYAKDALTGEELQLIELLEGDYQPGDYTLLVQVELDGFAIAADYLADLDPAQGKELKAALIAAYQSQGEGREYGEFMKASFVELYLLLVTFLPLGDAFEVLPFEAEREKLLHGTVSYQLQGRGDHFLAFLQKQEQDLEGNWYRAISVPETTSLVFSLEKDSLQVHYFHKAAREELKQILAPFQKELKLTKEREEGIEELCQRPELLWSKESFVPRECLLTFLQMDLYQLHYGLVEVQLEGEDETPESQIETSFGRFYLNLYLQYIEENHGLLLPPGVAFDYDTLRRGLGIPQEDFDFPGYAKVLHQALAWLAAEGYSWEIQKRANDYWGVYAPRAMPDLTDSQLWAAALVSVALDQPSFAELTLAFSVDETALVEIHDEIVDALRVFIDHEDEFGAAEVEEVISALGSWNLDMIAEVAPLVDKLRDYIDEDDTLKFMLATVLAEILEASETEEPEVALMSFYYGLAVHYYSQFGGTLLEQVAPGFLPLLNEREVESFRQLAGLALDIFARGEDEGEYLNLEGKTMEFSDLDLAEGELAVTLYSPFEERTLGSLVVAQEQAGEFITFTQQAFWNWRKKHPKGNYPTFLGENGFLLLKWLVSEGA